MLVAVMSPVTNANRKVVKIVFLIAIISSLLLQTLGLHLKLCAKRAVFSLARRFREKPVVGERLKMIRTADSPSNNAEENGTVLEGSARLHAKAVAKGTESLCYMSSWRKR